MSYCYVPQGTVYKISLPLYKGGGIPTIICFLLRYGDGWFQINYVTPCIEGVYCELMCVSGTLGMETLHRVG